MANKRPGILIMICSTRLVIIIIIIPLGGEWSLMILQCTGMIMYGVLSTVCDMSVCVHSRSAVKQQRWSDLSRFIDMSRTKLDLKPDQ